MACPICGRMYCDHSPTERGQTHEEMIADCFRPKIIQQINLVDPGSSKTFPETQFIKEDAMIVIYRAKKKWKDMTAKEMYYALKNQHYCDPEEDSGLVDSVAYSGLDRGYHRGEVYVYSFDYTSARRYCEEQYIDKCKEEGIEPEELPRWA